MRAGRCQPSADGFRLLPFLGRFWAQHPPLKLTEITERLRGRASPWVRLLPALPRLPGLPAGAHVGPSPWPGAAAETDTGDPAADTKAHGVQGDTRDRKPMTGLSLYAFIRVRGP